MHGTLTLKGALVFGAVYVASAVAAYYVLRLLSGDEAGSLFVAGGPWPDSAEAGAQ